jgi:putative SOS response-associated peptidase YedK
MCGRYTLARPLSDIAGLLNATPPADPERYEPSWNVAPQTEVLGLRLREEGRTLDFYRWGLVPSWAKDPAIGNRLINARAESVSTNNAFRYAFRRHRIAVIADGYLEWKKGPGKTTHPYLFRPPDGGLLTFAGLFETWHDSRPGANPDVPVRTCTVITTDASGDLAVVHNRMPVILPPDVLDAWLDPENDDTDELESFLRPLPRGSLTFYEVDRRVGSVDNNDPSFLEPAPVGESTGSGQTSLF